MILDEAKVQTTQKLQVIREKRWTLSKRKILGIGTNCVYKAWKGKCQATPLNC